TGVEGPQHRNRGGGGSGQFRRNVLGDGRETQHIDVQHFASALHCFEIGAAVIPEPEVQAFSNGRLLDDVCVAFELVANGRPGEIRAVRIEPLLHHQIDLTKVDIAKVDRDLFGVRNAGSKFAYIVGHTKIRFYHPTGWPTDVTWLLNRAFQGGDKNPVLAGPSYSLERVQPLVRPCLAPTPSLDRRPRSIFCRTCSNVHWLGFLSGRHLRIDVPWRKRPPVKWSEDTSTTYFGFNACHSDDRFGDQLLVTPGAF